MYDLNSARELFIARNAELFLSLMIMTACATAFCTDITLHMNYHQPRRNKLPCQYNDKIAAFKMKVQF
jgi:hypothetical protein